MDLRPRDSPTDEPGGSATLELDRTWTYGPDVQHGGALLERVAAVALEQVPHPHPVAVTSHFLRAPRLGSAEVAVDVLRRGRSVSTVHARLVQEGAACLDVVVTAGELGAPGDPHHSAGAPPDLPALEDCVRSGAPDGASRNGVTEQLELRLDPRAWVPGAAAAEVAEVRGWVRYADGREPDALALLCLSDALPPLTFALGLRGWAPTISLSVHVRALPAPGWLRVVQRAQLVADGWLDETCEIWDSADRLVAQAVQLAAYRA